MVDLTIDDHYNIIHKKYRGTLTIHDLFGGVEKTIWLSKSHCYSKLLLDFTYVQPRLSASDVKKLATHLNNDPNFLPLHIAIIADTPCKTAMSLLFKECMKKQSNIEVYSTHQKALDWLII